ncbi:endonuclease/exonuclease/phosphatase family protein [Streptomyces sp. NPDC006655]|uniref:endonuclease/exonuclease/phosphatase family protein n=1 Tax=Streptomyces sp. NPDC006655 TaxID=3156898 RepID=UPI003451BDBA
MTLLGHDPREIITLVSLNLEKDGGRDTGGQFPARWWAAIEFLKELRPDILLRQEATYSALHGARRHRATCELLGMRGILAPNNRGRNPTALYLRPATFPSFEITYDRPGQRALWRTPPAMVITQLAGVPEVDILIGSWHAAFNSAVARMLETDELTTTVDKIKQGLAWLGGGDCNEAAHPWGELVGPINWARPGITDWTHMVHRTVELPDGTRVNAGYLDRTLLSCGLHDVARYAAQAHGQLTALAPTGGHAPGAVGQGGPQRIDRVYADPWLTQAVISVRRLRTDRFSDHHAVEVIFSRPLLEQALRRQIAPLPRWNLGPPSTDAFRLAV